MLKRRVVPPSANGKVSLLVSDYSQNDLRGGILADESNRFLFVVTDHGDPVFNEDCWVVEADVEAIAAGVDLNLPKGSLTQWVTRGGAVLEVRQLQDISCGTDPNWVE